MSNDKCFCHFNGYEVKDAKARQAAETALANSESAVHTAGNADNNAGAAFQLASSALDTANDANSKADAAQAAANDAVNYAGDAGNTAQTAQAAAAEAQAAAADAKSQIENLRKNHKDNLILFSNTGRPPVKNLTDFSVPCPDLLKYNIVLVQTYAQGTGDITNVLCYLSKEHTGKIIITGVGCLPPSIEEGHHVTVNVSVYIDGYFNEETGNFEMTNYLGSEIESYVSVPGEATGDDVHAARPVNLIGIYGIL